MGAALLGGTLASVVGIGEAAADRGGCKHIGKRCKITSVSAVPARARAESARAYRMATRPLAPMTVSAVAATGVNETCEAPSPPPRSPICTLSYPDPCNCRTCGKATVQSVSTVTINPVML